MIEWDDNYSVNVSIIDEQHKKLIDIINKAITAKRHNDRPEEISEILYDMTVYAYEHFKIEEAYMKKYEYPEYEFHKNEHTGFYIKTLVYNNREYKGDNQITDDILEYLQQWLVGHIQITDKKYTDCFNKNGLK
jgi:hemerythrin